MKQVNLGTGTLTASRMGYGCMNLAGISQDKADSALDTALEAGFNLLDLADIYGDGKSEVMVGNYLQRRPDTREAVLLQSKCGIRFNEGPKRYDLRGDWIRHSLETSLQRLGTDYLDIFLLHRPDPLMHMEEVGQTLEILHREGKVRAFGVSNFPPDLLKELQHWTKVPLMINQLELNLWNCGLLTNMIYYNRSDAPQGIAPGEGISSYRQNNITLQAWSPLAGGYLSGRPIPEDHPQAEEWKALTQLVAQTALRRGTQPEISLLAWLLRLPVSIQPIVGTTNPERIRRCAEADHYRMSREEWYTLLEGRLARAIP